MSNCVEERRMGTFCVSQRIVKNNPLAVADMLRGMIVIRCEPAVGTDPLVMDLRYWAYSTLFDPLVEGTQIPAFIPCFNPDGSFKALEKLEPQDSVGTLRKIQGVLRDCMLLLAKAPLSHDSRDAVDVQKVLDFLERHKDVYSDHA